MTKEMEPTVIQNTTLSRFEITIKGQAAVLEYILEGKLLIIPHTEVPEALNGQGIGSRLAHFAMDYARREGLSVVPACEFIEGYLQRHPEYQDLVKKE